MAYVMHGWNGAEDAHRYLLAGLKDRLCRQVPIGVANEWAARISGGFGRLPIRFGPPGLELRGG